MIKCDLGGVDVHALIDTGSMKSFVSKHIFDKMRPLPVISNSISSCISITGEPLKIEGTIHTQLSFPCSGSAPYSGTFLVSSNLFQPLQCILGWDFLTHNSLQLSCTESGVYSIVGAHGITPLSPHPSPTPCPPPPPSLPGQNVSTNYDAMSPCLLVQSSCRGPVPVKLQSDICIPGRTEIIVSCSIPKSFKGELGMSSPLLGSTSLSSNILASYSVCQASSNCIPVCLMNTATVDIQLHAGQRVSEFIPLVESDLLATTLSENNSSITCSTATPVAIQHQLEAALSPSLNVHEKQNILSTPLRFSDVF